MDDFVFMINGKLAKDFLSEGELKNAIISFKLSEIKYCINNIHKTPILILDDAVSAVDTKTEEIILHNIMTERKDRTTLVVASRVSTVSHLDKIIVLNDGELEAFDTPANLLKISPTYQKMVKLQELEKEVEGGK